MVAGARFSKTISFILTTRATVKIDMENRVSAIYVKIYIY